MAHEALAPAVFVASGLLVASGALKLARPAATAGALAQARLPSPLPAVRMLGLVELAAGGFGLLHPVRPAAFAVAGLYAAFAGFLGWVLATGRAVSSCGCLGRREAPPSWLHVALDLAAAALAATAGVVASRLPSVVDVARSQPGLGLPFLAGLAAAGYAAYLAVAFVPELFGSYRPPAAEGEAA